MEKPGPAPSGVTLEQDGETTRIIVGSEGRALGPLFYLAVAALFGFVGYQIEPIAGAAAAGMALLVLAAMLVLSRLVNGSHRAPAICLTRERVWIDRPAPRIPAFIGTIRTAMQQAAGGRAPELQPVVESVPLKAIVRIRVGRAGALPQLLIEASAGRLEFVASPADEEKLEWVRRYLEGRVG